MAVVVVACTTSSGSTIGGSSSSSSSSSTGSGGGSRSSSSSSTSTIVVGVVSVVVVVVVLLLLIRCMIQRHRSWVSLIDFSMYAQWKTSVLGFPHRFSMYAQCKTDQPKAFGDDMFGQCSNVKCTSDHDFKCTSDPNFKCTSDSSPPWDPPPCADDGTSCESLGGYALYPDSCAVLGIRPGRRNTNHNAIGPGSPDLFIHTQCRNTGMEGV